MSAFRSVGAWEQGYLLPPLLSPILKTVTYFLCASLDDIGGEVWQLLKEGVSAPHGLSDHLGQLHGCQGGGEPAIATKDIHTGLDQANGLKGDETIHTYGRIMRIHCNVKKRKKKNFKITV